jgi:uncharacterized protein involved in exopolysaccharide biosynthesis
MKEQDSHIPDSGILPEELSSPETSAPVPAANLIDTLTQFAYRKWLIMKVTGIAILLGVILCLVLPVRYTATTKIMPPQQTPSTASLLMSQLNGGGAGALASMASAGGGLSLKDPNAIYVGLLTSRPIADAIIQKFNLATVYDTKDMTAARKKLAGYTQVTSEKNGFISVSVTDTDKRRVAEMANAYTDQLRILTKSIALTEASQRRLFYEEQLGKTKDALVAAQLAFQQVQQKKGLVQLDAQAKAMIEGLSAARAQVAAKQVEVQALRSYSTEHNPDVQLAEKELSSLQAEEARLEQHNQAPGAANLGLADVPSAGLEYLRAEHELSYQQTLYDMLMKQYEASRLDEAKEAAIIQVVEPAIEPDRKSAPKRLAILLLSAFVGLFSGFVLVRIQLQSESDPTHAKALLGLKCALIGHRPTKTSLDGNA